MKSASLGYVPENVWKQAQESGAGGAAAILAPFTQGRKSAGKIKSRFNKAKRKARKK